MDLLNDLIRIESLHRFVFDNLFVQNKKSYSKSEIKKKEEYEKLTNQIPNWRQLLINAYKNNPTESLKNILKAHKKITRYGKL